MQSTANINPLQLFQAFTEGTDPSCAPVTLQTRDNKNNLSMETRHITLTDIRNIEPCMWKDATNPVSKSKRSGCGAGSPLNGTCAGCPISKEGFTNQDEITKNNFEIDLCNRRIFQILQISTVILVIIVLLKIVNKKK